MSSQVSSPPSKKADRAITFRQAVTEALSLEMAKNDKVFLMGEDLGLFYGGGSFGVTPKELFLDKYGTERIRDTPISEAGFMGAGIMAAVAGFHPVVELMFSDFVGVCLDQIVNQGAKMRYMFGGQVEVPLTVRTTYGAGFSFAATHSQSLYSVFAHFPGVKVVVPSSPYDAKGLLTTAMHDRNVVVFFEHKGLYPTKGGEVPEQQYEIPFGQADVKRQGEDVTVVAVGMMTNRSLQAAKELAEEGLSVEVVDPRTIVPLDLKTILESVKKTSRLVIVDEDYLNCGFSAEVAAEVADEAFGFLDAPIKRVANPNIPIPYAKHLEDIVIPNVEAIKKSIRQVVSPQA